jgi:ribosome maturation factor RimP
MNPLVEALVAQTLDELGYDLVELRQGGTQRRPVLEVRIDRRDGGSVAIADCTRVSRALEPRLDASALLGSDYVLEVSSPGVERLLRGMGDWRRFAGRSAKVLSPLLGGRVEVEILGAEDVDGVETAVVRDQRGVEHRIPLSAVKEARLVFRWNK